MQDSSSRTPLIIVFLGIAVLALIALVYLVDQKQEANLPNVDVKTEKKEVTVPKVAITPPEQTGQPKSNN